MHLEQYFCLHRIMTLLADPEQCVLAVPARTERVYAGILPTRLDVGASSLSSAHRRVTRLGTLSVKIS